MKKLSYVVFFAALCTNAYAQKVCTNPGIPQFSILIDLSEPFDTPTAIAFSTLTRKIVDSLPSGGKLNVYTIKTNAEEVGKKPDYEICIPDFSSMKGNKFREKAKIKFEDEAMPNLEKLGNTISSAQKSPIIENIFKISHANFLKSTTRENHTLLLISDLIQYSDLSNFYKEVPSYSTFSSDQRGGSWLPKVNPTKMHIVVLSNASSSKLDLKKVRAFWLDYSRSNFKQCSFSGINEASVSFKNDC